MPKREMIQLVCDGCAISTTTDPQSPDLEGSRFVEFELDLVFESVSLGMETQYFYLCGGCKNALVEWLGEHRRTAIRARDAVRQAEINRIRDDPDVPH